MSAGAIQSGDPEVFGRMPSDDRKRVLSQEVISATGGVKRRLVTVDDFGDVLVQKISTKR